jgi:pimeloyl-ACP methyl ester carboxylesterase
MQNPLIDAAATLLDPQGRSLAASVRLLPLEVPGLPAQLQWPVAVLGEGPPLLLLHGFDSSMLEFRRLAPLLASNHQLWIADLCGFGFGPRPAGVNYGPNLVLAHLQALLAQLPPKPLGLIGASMGGAAAVVLARRLQEQNDPRLQDLLLLAPAGLTGRPMPLPPPLDRLGVKLLSLPAVRRGLCRQAFANPQSAVGPAEEQIASLHLQCPGWAAALASFARSGGFAGVGDPLPQLPISVLWGANDRILRAPQLQAANALLGGRCSSLNHCGHLPHLDRPEAVAAHWRNFRNSQGAS